MYIPSTGDLFITSNQFHISGQKKIQISRIYLNPSTKKYSCEKIEPGINLANGAVNYKDDGILFCEQGSLTSPGGLTLMSPLQPPYTTRPLLTNYHGRWFNSVNDVIVHSDGSTWFTDPDYGFEQNIRPRPQLPNQVYRYDTESGDVRAMAAGLGKPNGLCFSPDEETLYVTDTDAIHGEGPVEPSRASSMYVSFSLTSRIFPFYYKRRQGQSKQEIYTY